MVRLAWGVGVAFSLALLACAEETPPAQQVATIPSCVDSVGTCDNGLPLCMMDEDRACRMCRCSEYALAPLEPRQGVQAWGTDRPASYQPIFPAVTATENHMR
jgi:hypothetical protein